MKIYTKTGDDGTTGLIGNVRVMKNNPRIEAYGTSDELNSWVGLLSCRVTSDKDREVLQNIQRQLFALGADLATPSQKNMGKTRITQDMTLWLEMQIDTYEAELPSMKGFILPGGNEVAAICHLCRTTARRMERRIYDLHEQEPVSNDILQYVNRLSDFFFVLARKAANRGGNEIFL